MLRTPHFKSICLILLLSAVLLFSLLLLTTTPSTTDTLQHTKPQYFTHLLILILSTPAHHQDRTIIRQNGYIKYPWKDSKTGKPIQFKYLFVLGLTGDKAIDDAVRLEGLKYNDVIRGNFYDSYDTLTTKVLWAFDYSVKSFIFDFCLKVDEDTFVNVEYLNEYLKSVSLFNKSYQQFYAGKPRQGNLTISKEGKFKLENWEHNIGKEFVRYNLGGGYILSHPMMSTLCAVHRSGIVAPIKWEDVYVGVLAYLSGATPTRIYHYYVSKFYPFCTDSKTILLHHTIPLMQAKALTYWDKNRIYCPKEWSEHTVMAMYDKIELTDWGRVGVSHLTTAAPSSSEPNTSLA